MPAPLAIDLGRPVGGGAWPATGNEWVAFVGTGTGGCGILDVAPAARDTTVPVGGAAVPVFVLAEGLVEEVEEVSPSSLLNWILPPF
jgi:hypothetical protein